MDLHGPDPRWYIPDATPAWLKKSGSLANLRPPKAFRTPEEKRELRKSYPSIKNRYARFTAAGRCGVCGSERDRPGRAVCARCDARMKRWNRLRAARRVQNGLCPYCGEPPLRGRKYCRACQLKFKVLHRRRKHARQYETARRRKQTRLDAGQCPICTAPLAFGRQSCAGCLADKRAANRERKTRWAAANLCLWRAVTHARIPRAFTVALVECGRRATRNNIGLTGCVPAGGFVCLAVCRARRVCGSIAITSGGGGRRQKP